LYQPRSQPHAAAGESRERLSGATLLARLGWRAAAARAEKDVDARDKPEHDGLFLLVWGEQTNEEQRHG
jgi:hypothetical protein